ncbi:MAG: ferredoxin [Gaiellales bacterium]
MPASRVAVDGDACMGTATCVSLAPNTFRIGEGNVALVVDPAGDSLGDLLAAADACPTEAISVEPSDG